MVGRLQVVFDPNLFPFTDKSADNPRFKFLHTLLGRGSDAIDDVDKSASDDAVEVDLQDSSSAPHPPSDTDDAVSSEDDDSSKVLFQSSFSRLRFRHSIRVYLRM